MRTIRFAGRNCDWAAGTAPNRHLCKLFDIVRNQGALWRTSSSTGLAIAGCLCTKFVRRILGNAKCIEAPQPSVVKCVDGLISPASASKRSARRIPRASSTSAARIGVPPPLSRNWPQSSRDPRLTCALRRPSSNRLTGPEPFHSHIPPATTPSSPFHHRDS